ncbi:hypothetical protein M513_11478, partial [Trichuris suis]
LPLFRLTEGQGVTVCVYELQSLVHCVETELTKVVVRIWRMESRNRIDSSTRRITFPSVAGGGRSEVFPAKSHRAHLISPRQDQADGLPSYVANRVAEIMETTNATQRCYVPTRENPADDCSRGLSPSKISLKERWFAGQAFLFEEESAWPKWPQLSIKQAEVEELHLKWAGYTSISQRPLNELIYRERNLKRMCRVVAYTISFLNNCSSDRQKRWVGPLNVEDRALRACVSAAQHEGLEEEVACLLLNKPLKTQSTLLPLSPFIDNSGLMRVQGRIDKADIPYEARHPIILPPKHPLTKTIIEDMHRTLRHGSVDLILCELRQRYWLPKYRQRVKSVVYECVYCKKWRSKPSTPFLAQLPTERLQAFQPPFSCVGIDYFGPLTVLVRRSHEKRYGCLFTCMSTRAVHLEISFSLNTDSFLMAFRRFVDRRGTPAVAYSDNGTNFVAAERELRTCLQSWNQSKISEILAQRRIRWNFSPPAAPHFGGAWERLVRSAKVALRKILNGRAVTDEVLFTVVVEVESLMNSRPLTHVSLDPRDPEPLTPNHFLLGRAHPHIPPDIITEAEISSRRKWRCAQAMVEAFWKRWLREYVPSLIERRKWLRPTRNLNVGDLVLVVDHQSPRGHWPLGTIIECKPGADGIVRVAKVSTRHGTYLQGVQKVPGLTYFQKS